MDADLEHQNRIFYSVLGLIIGLLALAIALPDWVAVLRQWLFDWQTLVAGLFALFGAWMTVRYVRKQIAQQHQQYRSEQASRFAVAKSKTPWVAIEIADHARTYLKACEELWPLVKERSRDAWSFEGPEFPRKSEQILDKLVENTSDEALISQIAALYSEHQVMVSRLSNIEKPDQHTVAIIDYMLQPLMMDAIAMKLLEFGRDGQDFVAITWETIEWRANALVSSSEIKDSIQQHILDKKNRNKKVPLALRRHAT
jgi:hypothetical protein